MKTMTFEQCVAIQKASAYLLKNDAFVRTVGRQSMESLEHAIFMAVVYGSEIKDRIDKALEVVEVTEQERQEGYPLPRDEAERQQRQELRECLNPNPAHETNA